MTVYRYSGAGNTFVIIDGRNIDTTRYRKRMVVRMLCACHGTDGLMILDSDPECDFSMSYFNSDGSSGMMCGNGGRCITAFADVLNIHPAGEWYSFRAPDGIHRARILSHLGEMKEICLSMGDVCELRETPYGIFLNTGTRHLVVFVPDAETVDVDMEGRRLRSLPDFAPEGVNVDFVSVLPGDDGDSVRLRVRTFEKGVEAETEACGTGVTAAAIAAFHRGTRPASGTGSYEIIANGGDLSVHFRPIPMSGGGSSYTDVLLTGPTLCEGDLCE